MFARLGDTPLRLWPTRRRVTEPSRLRTSTDTAITPVTIIPQDTVR
jgi:hypothetical protein